MYCCLLLSAVYCELVDLTVTSKRSPQIVSLNLQSDGSVILPQDRLHMFLPFDFIQYLGK